MDLRIVNPDPTYAPVDLVEPTTCGYLHVAASVSPGPDPIPKAGRADPRFLARLKQLARQLEQLDEVEQATVFRAIVFAPTHRVSSYLRQRGAALHVPRFDVVVLVETTSPASARQVQASPAYQALVEALRSQARDLHLIAARNARRIADVDRSRDGLFLFNYFVADDADVMLALWDHLAGWYAVETGLDNSTLLTPLDGEPCDYTVINFARWDISLPRFLFRQMSKRSFRTFVQANLEANRAGSMPVLYRLA